MAYLDAVVFGNLLHNAMHNAGLTSAVQLAGLLSALHGLVVDPQRIDDIITGDAPCDVGLYFAIVETLETPGGTLWFGPAFRPSSMAHLRHLFLERFVDGEVA